MKKLTAGIFASLLAVVATGAANAKIASQAYVDEKDAERVAVQQETNNGILTTSATGAVQVSSSIPQARVDGLDTALAGKADKATTLAGYGITDGATTTELTEGLAGKVDDADIADMQVKSNLVKTAGWATGKTDDTKYPSAAAVNDAITAATKDIASSGTVEQIQDDLDAAELEIDSLQTDVSGLETSKQNANLGAEAANHIVTTDSTGKITSSATIEAAKVDGLSTVATTGAYGDLSGTPTLGALAAKDTVATADIDNNAVTTAKIADGNVTKAKLESSVQTTLDSVANKANTADVYTKTQADSTFIPAPDPECTNMGAKCVLVVGSDGYAWEVIARGTSESSN